MQAILFVILFLTCVVLNLSCTCWHLFVRACFVNPNGLPWSKLWGPSKVVMFDGQMQGKMCCTISRYSSLFTMDRGSRWISSVVYSSLFEYVFTIYSRHYSSSSGWSYGSSWWLQGYRYIGRFSTAAERHELRWGPSHEAQPRLLAIVMFIDRHHKLFSTNFISQ